MYLCHSFSQKHLFNLSKNAFILWNTKKGGLHRPEVLGGPSKSNFGKIWLKLDEPLPPRDPQWRYPGPYIWYYFKTVFQMNWILYQGVSDHLKVSPEAKKHQFALINHNIFMKMNRFACFMPKSLKKKIFGGHFFYFCGFFWIFSVSDICFFVLTSGETLFNFDNIKVFFNEKSLCLTKSAHFV